jgi:hypothetical protein
MLGWHPQPVCERSLATSLGCARSMDFICAPTQPPADLGLSSNDVIPVYGGRQLTGFPQAASIR